MFPPVPQCPHVLPINKLNDKMVQQQPQLRPAISLHRRPRLNWDPEQAGFIVLVAGWHPVSFRGCIYYAGQSGHLNPITCPRIIFHHLMICQYKTIDFTSNQTPTIIRLNFIYYQWFESNFDMTDQLAMSGYARPGVAKVCFVMKRKPPAQLSSLMTGGDPAITLMSLFPVKRSTKPERVMTPD